MLDTLLAEDVVLGVEPGVAAAWARRFPGAGLGAVPLALVHEVVLATALPGDPAAIEDAAAALGVLRAQQGRQVSALCEDLLALRTSLWGLVAGHERLGGRPGELLAVQARCTEAVDEALRAAVAAFVGEAQRVLASRATRDQLTGLLNRAAFDEALEHEVAARTDPPSLLLVDLDGFKQVNDTLGHLAGDDVLVAAADLLTTVCRSGDVVGRIGGDEFAVLLPTCPPLVAERVARRLLAAAERAKGLRPRGADPVGLSVGLGWRAVPTSAQALFSAADDAMYTAKRSGGAALSTDADGHPEATG